MFEVIATEIITKYVMMEILKVMTADHLIDLILKTTGSAMVVLRQQWMSATTATLAIHHQQTSINESPEISQETLKYILIATLA